jgi:hypothetical protein
MNLHFAEKEITCFACTVTIKQYSLNLRAIGSIGLDCDGRRTIGVNLPCRGYDKWRSAARCRAKKVKLVFPPHQKERLLVNAIISFVCADSVAAPTWAPLLRLKIIWVFRKIARWFQTQHTRRRTVILLPTHHWLDWTFLEWLNDYWGRISKLKPAVLTFNRRPTLRCWTDATAQQKENNLLRLNDLWSS